MIEYLGITPLLDAKFWPSLFSESARQSREVAEVYEGLIAVLTRTRDRSVARAF